MLCEQCCYYSIEVDQIYLRNTEFGTRNKLRERYFPDKEMLFNHNWIDNDFIYHYSTQTRLDNTNQFMLENLKVNGVSISELGTYDLKYDYYF